jgi:hypothetical protein
MKAITILWFIAVPAIVASAQIPNTDHASPHVQVLSQKWSKISLVQLTERPDYGEVMPAPSSQSRPPRRSPIVSSTRYLYEAKVRNAGDKVIRAMRWDYVFTDPETKEEIDRRRFYSTVTIHPNQEKTLEGYTRSSPIEIVSVRALPVEQVIVECITLSDGSTWRLPSFKGSCKPVKQPPRSPAN